ncbi:MAG: DNA-directed RNA polymerase subunit omega [Verrucomicrobia bacterium Tous-C9LFEB]|nr:MAG: DNA-directed RNA polymerase subunit omega [Verrucomicrobia bacterium Tous-C9LFEB]
MTNALVQDALKKVGSPEILVNIVSKRVRQLGQGFRPLLEVQPRWSFMEIALREVSEGKLTFEAVEDEAAPKRAKKIAA